jgi:two-component system phosphate regulon sensor histidine kinase PhoR
MLRYVKLAAKPADFTYIRTMILNRKRIGVLITLIIISLAGFIIIQGLLLNDAVNSREQTFGNNVASALTTTSDLIETHHTVALMIGMAGDMKQLDSMRITLDADDISLKDSVKSRLIVYRPDTVITKENKLDSASLRIIVDGIKNDSLGLGCFSRPGIHHKTITNECEINDEGDSTANAIKVVTAAISERSDFIQRILNQMWVAEAEPIESRLDSALIDSSIAQSLNDVGIDLDYVFGVRIGDADSLVMAPAKYHDKLLQSKYRTRLFPLDVISEKAELLLYFPARQVYLWKQILPMLITIGIFILIIVVTFVYSIKVILLQKRNEALMADFVNNMTHEFKTPISTIALATEAIMRKDMISDSERVAQFSKMIQDENRRMRHQAEKILHMASLENGELRLKLDTVDVHQVIREALDNIVLSVEKQDGTVSFEANADRHIIEADKLHLTGIINNLLDNAVKYSPENTKIRVSTHNVDNSISIVIADNGIGINKADLKLVFNKYFRVSSGNIHNVKGFGLGLSYVKMMVKAHHGTIDIKSKLGQGTSVELIFPVKDNVDD